MCASATPIYRVVRLRQSLPPLYPSFVLSNAAPPMVAQERHQQELMQHALTTTQQLHQARDYLATLQSDRAESCADLEEEAKIFLSTPSTEEQNRRFRLIYQLVRYQVTSRT